MVVIDDHAIVRDGLARLLSETAGMEVIAVAATLHEGIARVTAMAPDVVVADMVLGDGNATELLRVVHRRQLAARIVVLTGLEDALAVAEAVRDGAAGYVLKMQPVAELVEAIRTAAAGGRYLSGAVGGDAAVAALERSGLLKLSRREGEIFRLTVKGETAKEIGRKLLVSAKTIQKHRCNINRKLGVRTTVEMMRVAARHGVAIAPKLPL